jgi:AcrR family transcriptional regulator
VHYHFATKRRLLVATAAHLAARRAALRRAPMSGARGLAALDALWEGLTADAARDVELAWLDLLHLSRNDRAVAEVLLRERESELRAMAAALPDLLLDLGSRPRIPPDDLAALVVAFLDGAAEALAAGADAVDLRAAYDAFCLALVALGQRPPER